LSIAQNGRQGNKRYNRRKGALLELDDSENDIGGRNKEKSEENKNAKKRIKLEAKATNLSKKIEEIGIASQDGHIRQEKYNQPR
jgi:hypothetical protein